MQEITNPSERLKLNLARLKKAGMLFEINVDPDLAMKFKKGEDVDIREVLKAEQIFSDAKKGELASEDKLTDVFHTKDTLKIAEIIIKDGEIQLTSEFRSEQREKKKKKIIGLVHKNGIDPSTKLPHPLTRIENAFQEAKIKIDEHKSAEEQFDKIASELKAVLPLSFEKAKLTVTISPSFAPKAYPVVQKYGKFLKENWNSDGSWTVVLEIPAGLKPEFIDKLNSFTHGEVKIEE